MRVAACSSRTCPGQTARNPLRGSRSFDSPHIPVRYRSIVGGPGLPTHLPSRRQSADALRGTHTQWRSMVSQFGCRCHRRRPWSHGCTARAHSCTHACRDSGCSCRGPAALFARPAAPPGQVRSVQVRTGTSLVGRMRGLHPANPPGRAAAAAGAGRWAGQEATAPDQGNGSGRPSGGPLHRTRHQLAPAERRTPMHAAGETAAHLHPSTRKAVSLKRHFASWPWRLTDSANARQQPSYHSIASSTPCGRPPSNGAVSRSVD